jgi:hypothetical protein
MMGLIPNTPFFDSFLGAPFDFPQDMLCVFARDTPSFILPRTGVME